MYSLLTTPWLGPKSLFVMVLVEEKLETSLELERNPEVPRKFPRLPRKFPKLPQRSAPFLWDAWHPLVTHKHFLSWLTKLSLKKKQPVQNGKIGGLQVAEILSRLPSFLSFAWRRPNEPNMSKISSARIDGLLHPLTSSRKPPNWESSKLPRKICTKSPPPTQPEKKRKITEHV